MIKTQFLNDRAVATVSVSTFDGLFFRDNLASEGDVPAAGPYNRTPDIIRSATPIANAQTVLSTYASWQTTYETQPAYASENYYYVRGMNGQPADAFNGTASLYWAPAQLILFPGTWKNNPLSTASGSEAVAIAADTGHIGVGADAFEWDGLLLPEHATFYSIVSQSTSGSAAAPGPIPPVSSLADMSQLLTQSLCFGFSNTAYLQSGQIAWLHRVEINIPASIDASNTLVLTVSSNGFDGDTLGLIVDQFSAGQQSIVMNPTRLQSGAIAGIQFSVDPGMSATMAIQYWHTGATLPQPGATLSISVDYLVPDSQLEDALKRGIIDSAHSKHALQALGVQVQPQAAAPLGAITFVVGPMVGG